MHARRVMGWEALVPAGAVRQWQAARWLAGRCPTRVSSCELLQCVTLALHLVAAALVLCKAYEGIARWVYMWRGQCMAGGEGLGMIVQARRWSPHRVKTRCDAHEEPGAAAAQVVARMAMRVLRTVRVLYLLHCIFGEGFQVRAPCEPPAPFLGKTKTGVHTLHSTQVGCGTVVSHRHCWHKHRGSAVETPLLLSWHRGKEDS